ncbi:GNAT family N-acetyltransferase [Synechococcus sp. LTW-R]|uniref:GNAT family N-acetyltransferase n=1 Tax=Synechococcus sp. LTW-R TaxID=2751170 RepID=UPI0016234328|nr:GNAT family N-acetyltransferase [Synechococcus sp. LTW-R]QNG28906.1 GNAT family N-acetyltransferase [Synechococcus sp. LTW-R]
MIDSDLNYYEWSDSGVSVVGHLCEHDSLALGEKIFQIDEIGMPDYTCSPKSAESFRRFLLNEGFTGATARVKIGSQEAITFLQSCEFIFIETIIEPFVQTKTFDGEYDWSTRIRPAEIEDIQHLKEMAFEAFSLERYHSDNRYDSRLASKRYSDWIEKAVLERGEQVVDVVIQEGLQVGFFISKFNENGEECMWLLNCIAPSHQGKGIGKRAWTAMIYKLKQEGVKTIKTSVTATNTRVLGLYSTLQFRYLAPLATFHWKEV